MSTNRELRSAYGACARVAQAHYENFPVASWLLPQQMRQHVAVVYAFARAADDFVDEGKLSENERCTLLDGWTQRLQESVIAFQPGPPPRQNEPLSTTEIFLALGATIREKRLPIELFLDLISAFRQDITTTRYASWVELFDYCRRSANPVGRLMLRIAGESTDVLDSASDAVCTALQLTNFWQDMKSDFERGRIYLPEQTWKVHGAREIDLQYNKMSPEWRTSLSEAVSRTRQLFLAGQSVCDFSSGWFRYELRATWLGGVRILDRIEDVDFDVLQQRPTLRTIDGFWFLWQILAWHGIRDSR